MLSRAAIVLCVTLVLPLSASAQALAEDEPEGHETPEVGGEYSTRFTGVFWEIGATGGVQLLSGDAFDGSMGYGVGGFARLSFALQLFDFQLSYLRGEHAPEVTTPGLEAPEIDISTDTIALSVGLHPLFLAFMMDPNWGYLFGSMYIMGGVNLDRATFSRGSGTAYEQDWAIGWHLGAGLDYPLTNPQNPTSVWVGAQYRYNTISSDLPELEAVGEELHKQHYFLGRISLRFNGLPF